MTNRFDSSDLSCSTAAFGSREMAAMLRTRQLATWQLATWQISQISCAIQGIWGFHSHGIQIAVKNGNVIANSGNIVVNNGIWGFQWGYPQIHGSFHGKSLSRNVEMMTEGTAILGNLQYSNLHKAKKTFVVIQGFTFHRCFCRGGGKTVYPCTTTEHGDSMTAKG